jgi:ATP phosphoribosyltransferase
VLFVRDDDIPDLVQEDVCDLGLVGLNVLEEKRLELAARGHSARLECVRTLDFGRCPPALAIPQGSAWEGTRSLRGRRIATTYPFLLGHYLREREITPRLGRADLICDLVATGSTCRRITCARLRRCWRVTRCSSARRSICRRKSTSGCSGC